MSDHNTEFADVPDRRFTIAASAAALIRKRLLLQTIELFCVDQRQLLQVSLHIFRLVGGLAWRKEIARRRIIVWARVFFGLRFSRKLWMIRPESGFCFTARGPLAATSDKHGLSKLFVLEDGSPLSAPHTGHDEIRRLGCGRYSHWGRCIYFSSSDNTDPRYNGRNYKLVRRL